MRVDTINTKPIYSSFLSCQQDAEDIIKILFVKNKPYSDKLKRLLIINNPDCLDENNTNYQKLIDSKPLSVMRKEGYIRLNPKIARREFQQIKSYIYISFDGFTSNRVDSKFRDGVINFDIICYDDQWELQGFKIRPLVIAGYIDGILNSISNQNRSSWDNRVASGLKLSGMGEYKFLGCNLTVLNEDISMYTLSYYAVHFTEDLQKEVDS